MLKIFKKIINNPSQIEKYGDLRLKRISAKLSKCQPAFDLLFIAGFRRRENNKRLVWSNTNDNNISLKRVYEKLKSMDNNGQSNLNDNMVNQMVLNILTTDQTETYNQLIKSGYNNDQAMTAITLSQNENNDQQPQNVHNHQVANIRQMLSNMLPRMHFTTAPNFVKFLRGSFTSLDVNYCVDKFKYKIDRFFQNVLAKRDLNHKSLSKIVMLCHD